MIARFVRDYSCWFINLVTSLGGMAALMILIWDFDYFEESYVRVIFSAVLPILPLLVLIDVRNLQSEYHDFNLFTVGFMLFSFCFLAIAFGDRYNLSFLVLNGVSSVLSLPLLFAHWCVSNKKPLVRITAVPTVTMGFIYMASKLSQSDTATDLLLLPLPFVLLAGLIWAFFARWSLEHAKHTRHRSLMGPFMESLTMFLLVVPLAALAMLIVDATYGRRYLDCSSRYRRRFAIQQRDFNSV